MTPCSPSNGDEMLDRCGLLLDQSQARRDIAERDHEVSEVRDGQGRRIDPMKRMGAVHQHSAGLPDRRRPEPGAAPVRRADVERDAGDADLGRPVSVHAEEGRWDREGRRSAHAPDALGFEKRNTAAATAQVQSPLCAPSAAAVSDRLSTMRSLIS